MAIVVKSLIKTLACFQILCLLVVSLPMPVSALSDAQLKVFKERIYYFDVDNNSLGSGLGGLLGSTCYSATTPTINDPTALGAAIDKFISENGGGSSPMAGMGSQIVEGATRAGVNPFLVITIARKESSFGVNTPSGSNNSFGRTATDSQPHVSASGRNWYKWSSFAASINSQTENDEPTYIKDEYLSQGLTTITSLISKYAPPSENDTTTYVQQLNEWIDQLVANAGDSISCGVSGSLTSANFVLFSQFDPRWTNKPYGSLSLGDIGASGCGPTSMAMVVTNLTGTAVTPDVIASKFGRDHVAGADGKGGGSSWQLFPDVAGSYGLTSTSIGKDLAAAARALASGKLVVAAGQGTDPFTGGGHILVLRGITSGGKFLLGDPNTTYPPDKDPGNTTPKSANQLLATGLQGLWVISK